MTDIEHEKEESPVPVEERSRAPAPEASRAAGGHRVATSTYRGVCWHRKSRRWQSAINSSGRHVYLGSFDTEEEAARMFDKVAIRVRGHKAKLNFPYEDYVGPDGQLITDPKLEQLVSEAQKALLEKQRWQEAQDDAGMEAKRRRLMHTQSGGLNGHLGPWSLGPAAAAAGVAVPGAADIGPLGVGRSLGLTPLSHDTGVGMYGSSGTAGIHAGLDLNGGPEFPFDRLGGVVGGGPSRPGDVGGVIATEGLLSRLQQQQQQFLLPGEQSAAVQLLLQASLGGGGGSGGGGSGGAGGEAPPGSAAAALNAYSLSGLGPGGLVGGGWLTRGPARGTGAAGGSMGDVTVRPEAASLVRQLLPPSGLTLSTAALGKGPAAGAVAAAFPALNAAGAGDEPSVRVRTLAATSRGQDEDEENEGEDKGGPGARAGPRMRYQTTGPCLLNLNSGDSLTGGSAQQRWDSLGHLVITGGGGGGGAAGGSSRVARIPPLQPSPQLPHAEGLGGPGAVEVGAADVGGGGASAGRNNCQPAPAPLLLPLPPAAPPRQAPAAASPSALPSLIARFLANVWDHLPAGMMVDSLVPSSDTALLGFTYMPAAAGRVAGVGVGMARARAGSDGGGGGGGQLRPAARGRAGGPGARTLPSADGNSGDDGASGSGNDTGTIRVRQGSVGSDGSGGGAGVRGGGGGVVLARGTVGGAGVYFRGIYRDLGVYTTMTDAMQACKACMAMLLDVQEMLGPEVAIAAATTQEQPPQLARQQQSLQAGQAAHVEPVTRPQCQPEVGGIVATATAAAAARPAAAVQLVPAEQPFGLGAAPLGSVLQSHPHPRQPHHDQSQQAREGVPEGRQGLDQPRASSHQRHPPPHRPHPHRHDMQLQPRHEEAPLRQLPSGHPLKREDVDSGDQAGLGAADPEGVRRAQLQAQLLQHLQARATGASSGPMSAMAAATATVAATPAAAAAAAAAASETVDTPSGAQGSRGPYDDPQQPTRRSPTQSRGEEQQQRRSTQPPSQSQPPELVAPQTLQLLLQLLAATQQQQAQRQAQLPSLSGFLGPPASTLLQPQQQRTVPPQLHGVWAATAGPHPASARDALGTGLLRQNHHHTTTNNNNNHQNHHPHQQQRQDSGSSDSTTESSGSMRASRAGQEQPAGGGSRTSSGRGLPGNEEGREQAPRGTGLTAA